MWKFKYVEVGAGTRVYRSLSFGQQQDQLLKVKYITSSISRRPPALSEDVWTVHSSSSLRCCLLSSHPNPVWIFRRGNSIFQLTWTSEHFSGGSGLCRTWNIYIIAVKERENQSINITRQNKIPSFSSTQNRDKSINPFNGHMQL